MNAIRLVLPALFLGLVGSSVWADEKPDFAKLIIGNWEVTKVEANQDVIGAIREFLADGKGSHQTKLNGKDVTIEKSYTLEADKLEIKTVVKGSPRGRSEVFTIKKLTEKELVLANAAGKLIELTRKEKVDYAKLIVGTWELQSTNGKKFTTALFVFDNMGKQKYFCDVGKGLEEIISVPYRIEGNTLIGLSGNPKATGKSGYMTIKKLNETEMILDNGTVLVFKRKSPDSSLPIKK